MMPIFLESLLKNFEKFPQRNAFFIRDRFHTYDALRAAIGEAGDRITALTDPGQQYIGLITYDDLETYASIYALWFLGKAYVPLNPGNPPERNREIIRQMGIRTLLTSRGNDKESAEISDTQQDTIIIDTGTKAGAPSGKTAGTLLGNTSGAPSDAEKARPDEAAGNDFAPGKKEIIPSVTVSGETDCYVLFTSGSTGKPKGVPINRNNLASFVSSFINAGYLLDENDRFLQIYDLSFDASVHCFTVPLTVGGCVYTVPRDQIKYLYAYKLMKEQQLTFVKMPPSTLSYLQPYFKSIRLEQLRYCLLGGEAFAAQLAERWAPCVPNAQIQNVYGPTEFTVNSHIFNWRSKQNKEKSKNGIVSIGKPFGDTVAMVAGKRLEPLGEGEKGELCLSGNQQTKGYWKDDEQTGAAFFEREVDGVLRRFYRTGDLVYRDKDGDFMYIGRLDSQVQIQGFRVEISEIEKHALDYLQGTNLAVIARAGENQVTELYLFVEDVSSTDDEIIRYLEKNLPAYMVPRKVINLPQFPKSAGGKINRTALKKMIPDE